MGGSLALGDWRRRVADNYARVRTAGAGEAAWSEWRATRDVLFRRHPQSPVPPAQRTGFTGMAFFPYDPSWRLIATVHEGVRQPPAPPDARGAPDAAFISIGEVRAERGGHEIVLPLLWLTGYGGGLFLPFRDATNGAATYGGGRYLLDQAKGADLGALPDGRLVLDFNFGYHPSCAHDERWECPLAPPGATVPAEVRAGEMAPGG